MKIRQFFVFLLLSIMLGAFGLSNRALAAAEKTSFDVDKAIAAGDHQGLSDYYKSQADLYRQKAQSHENMHADYKKSLVHYKGMENTFTTHCNALKKAALNTAAQYDDLASEEAKLAKKPKK
jgi:hypothetical protein